jgi:RNA polymerase sigma-70 factor (ECF subfamily)
MASGSQPLVLLHTAAEPEVERLFHEFRKPLLRFLVCSGASADEGLDIVQDTFLRLHQHLLGGGARDNLRAWVFRVAHNAALNRRKSKSGWHEELKNDAACPRDNPERQFLKKERFRRLHQAMRELSAIERECVVLRSEGLRYREIGEVLEMGTSTAADHLDRALRKLGEKCNV